MLEFIQIPLLKDNYSVIVHNAKAAWTLVIDPAEAEPIARELTKRGWFLTYILNTHWHGDHVGGNLALKSLYGAKVFGAGAEGESIPGLDVDVWGLDTLDLPGTRVEVLRVPGHTPHHVAYHFLDEGVLFAGDTLFSMGCGRLLGGTAEDLWASLDRLRQLSPETRVYCAHEYTVANARFAQAVEPLNPALALRRKEVERLLLETGFTVPFSLGDERATNPFLRPESPEIRASLGVVEDMPNLEVFRELRRRKDVF